MNNLKDANCLLVLLDNVQSKIVFFKDMYKNKNITKENIIIL